RQRGVGFGARRRRRSFADKPIMFCSYPITPASPLLHQLVRYGNLGIGTFQAEDEIAAVCAAMKALKVAAESGCSLM
ncbi:MAG: hypothetical protein HC861_08645, partial [Rhodospirillaceae bacterium]|nr:hypothetical protein [Rhodospirillaceae bacterium]